MYTLHSKNRLNTLLNQHWDGYLPIQPERLIPSVKIYEDATLPPDVGYHFLKDGQQWVLRLAPNTPREHCRFHIAKAIVWISRGYTEAIGLRNPFDNEPSSVLVDALHLLIPRIVFQNNLRTTFRMPTWNNWRFWNPTPDAIAIRKLFDVSSGMLTYYLTNGLMR